MVNEKCFKFIKKKNEEVRLGRVKVILMSTGFSNLTPKWSQKEAFLKNHKLQKILRFDIQVVCR